MASRWFTRRGINVADPWQHIRLCGKGKRGQCYSDLYTDSSNHMLPSFNNVCTLQPIAQEKNREREVAGTILNKI